MIESFEGVWPEIHPTAFVHPSAVIIGRVQIGPLTSIWPNVVLRGDDAEILIGSRSNIQDGCVVHGTQNLSQTVVGDCVTVGHLTTLHGCVIHDHVLVGMGSTLLDNSVLKAHCLLGACSLLTQRKTIPSGHMAFGNPARVIRLLTDRERADIEFSWNRYLELTECILGKEQTNGD